MTTALSVANRPPALTMSSSLADLHRRATTRSWGDVDVGGAGDQEAMRLSDDLLIVRSDVHSLPPVRLEIDMQGWLMLHFRLRGSSIDRYPDGREFSHDEGCFVVSSCSSSRPLVRELRTDDWRSVTIVCPASFVECELHGGVVGEIPEAMQRFGVEVDFVHAGALTSGMRAAAEALLHATMPFNLRSVYMRAKAVELLCLAFQQIQDQSNTGPAIRLSRRDEACLHQARLLLSSLPRAPSLDELARHVGINRKKLALGFKQVFGMTVGEFDRAQRLERARDLIEQGGHSIGQVAWLAGYADQSSFSKAFKARYGALPRDSRVV